MTPDVIRDAPMANMEALTRVHIASWRTTYEGSLILRGLMRWNASLMTGWQPATNDSIERTCIRCPAGLSWALPMSAPWSAMIRVAMASSTQSMCSGDGNDWVTVAHLSTRARHG